MEENSLSPIQKLKQVFDHISSSLPDEDKQNLSNMCNSIKTNFKGDGAGLTGGILVDILMNTFLKNKLPDYHENHKGESDMVICGLPFSLKKINGKSTCALDWSKNKKDEEPNLQNLQKKEIFSCDLIVINLKSGQWWKKKPKNVHSTLNIIYTSEIPSGIYLIDKSFCKHYVELHNNNKTNTLIDSMHLYIMLKRSISLKLYIPLPEPNKQLKFNILHAFLE